MSKRARGDLETGRPRRELVAEDWRDITSWLLGESIDEAFDQILQRLGESQGVDRAWLLRLNESVSHFWITHEWTTKGVISYSASLKGVPVDLNDLMNRKLLQNEAVMIDEVEDMADLSADLHKEFMRQGIRSLIAVPFFWEGRMVMQLGFDAVRAKRAWDVAEEVILRKVGELMVFRLMTGKDLTVLTPPDLPSEFEAIMVQDSQRGSVEVDARDVLWIEGARNYSLIHLRQGTPMMIYRSLTEWEEELRHRNFLRVHRSYILNMDHLIDFSPSGGVWQVALRDCEQIFYVGRKYRAALSQHFSEVVEYLPEKDGGPSVS